MEKIKIEIKWAVIFMISQLLWMFIEKLSGLHSTHIDQHMFWTNMFAIIAIMVYVFALRDKKKSDYSGQMTYVQGLKSGLIISVIVAILSPLTQWITASVITPEYFSNIIEYSVKEGHYDSVEEAQKYFNLKKYMVQSAVGALMMGIITSAVVAAFVRTKSKS